jgi:hypothetical protein
MSDPSRPSALTVLGGPLNGTRLVVDPAQSEVLIGSDVRCTLRLELAGIAPVHARLHVGSGSGAVYETRGSALYINDQKVIGAATVRDGDILWLGAPGNDGSVMIQCRLPAAATPAPEGFAPSDSLQPPVSAPPSGVPLAQAEPPPIGGGEFFIADDGGFQAPPVSAPLPAAPPQTLAEDAFFVAEPAATVAPGTAEPATEVMPDDFFVMDSAGSAQAGPPPPPSPSPDDAFFVDEAPAPASPHDFVSPSAPTAVTWGESDAFPPFDPAPAPTLAPPIPPAPPPMVAAPLPPVAVPPAPAVVSRPAPPPAAAAPPPAVAPAAPRAGAPAAPQPVAPAAVAAAAPVPAPRPAAPRPTPRPPVAAAPRAVQPPPARRGRLPKPLLFGILGLLVVVVAGIVAVPLFSVPRLEAVGAPRVRAGQTLALTGRNFSASPQGNVVLFGENTPGRVVSASATQIQVEVPELPVTPGQDTPTTVRVRSGSRETQPLALGVYAAPRIHGVSPDAALPGEVVELSGSGWGPGVKVRFGSLEAVDPEVHSTSLKVRVPEIRGGLGTSAPVVVVMNGEESNAAPFLLGHLPLIVSLTPAQAAPGDLVTFAGRGFQLRPTDNIVRIGGAHALVVTASGSELKVVVPQVGGDGGDTSVELRCLGFDNLGQATLKLAPPANPIDFRFVAEPFDDVEGHDHAVLATELGPAFVLSASGGRSAAERAFEAQRRLNAAAVLLKASRDQDVETRALESAPIVALVGKPEALLEVSQEDAAAYNEDWTKAGAKAGGVTRSRLARWWGAEARDLVLLLVRSEKPQHAATLAPEGRVLGDVFAAARKAITFGVPRSVLGEGRPPLRDALRVVGLRVPAGVAALAGEAPAAPVATAVTEVPLRLEGEWTGYEVEGGTRRRLLVTFVGRGGNVAYAGGVSLPLAGVEQAPKGVVRFNFQVRGSTHFFSGHWDGQKIAGTISSDLEGKNVTGAFDLTPSR